MTTWIVNHAGLVSAGAASAVVALWALWTWAVRPVRHDRRIFSEMAPLMEALWKPLRHLSERDAVWPDLTEEQRREIETSRPYREQHHERIADERARELAALARRIRSIRYWRLREEVIAFAKDWRRREPDQLRVLLEMVQQQIQSD